jgi:hypothetical protein
MMIGFQRSAFMKLKPFGLIAKLMQVWIAIRGTAGEGLYSRSSVAGIQ